jgi:uncharacterized repeat protein (TIGR01451 family)
MKRLINTVIVWIAFVGFAQAQSWYKTYSFDEDTTVQEEIHSFSLSPKNGYYLFTSRFPRDTCFGNIIHTMRQNVMYLLDKNGEVKTKRILTLDSSKHSEVEFVGFLKNTQMLFSGKMYTKCTNQPISQKILYLTDSLGNIIWKKIEKADIANLVSVAIQGDTIFRCLAKYTLQDTASLTYQLIDIQGNLLLENTIKENAAYISPGEIKYTNNHFYHIMYLDKKSIIQEEYSYIQKIDKNLNLVASNKFKAGFNTLRVSNNEIITKGYSSSNSLIVFRLDLDLKFTRKDSFFINIGSSNFPLNDEGSAIVSITKIADLNLPIPKITQLAFNKYTLEGKILYYKKIDYDKDDFCLGVIEQNNNFVFFGLIRYGWYKPNPKAGFRPFVCKIDTAKSSIINFLKGKLAKDENLNCKVDTSEKGIPKIPIHIIMPKDSFWLMSDNNGEYYANVLDSVARVKIIAGTYWKMCQDSVIRYKGIGEEKTLNLPLKPLINCPLLEVSLATQRLRRCFDNVYTLQYCNRGTAAANNAYVEVDFDKWLTIKASSILRTLISGNKYRFNVGEIKELDCANFTVTVNVNCDSTVLGQTHCSTAHIYPDSACIVDNGWDKSSIAIQAKCNNGKVNLSIKNVGTAPTSQARQSIVIEDQIMFLQSPVNLNPGETKDLEFNPKGKTMRFLVEQAKNHPSRNAFVTTAVEGCGAASPSLGFVTQFGESDNEPWLDSDCRQNIGAYDPNEKSSAPQGYGALHQIEPNAEIEYQINFQNEGTDTAFTVVLRDTIDNNLNISTLQMGASSHSYTWELINRGTLKVTFNNIYLTTKKQNEAKSQGFVRYRIAQHRDVALGKSIKNRAGIYFDFNPPIMTNTTTHLVSKNFVVVAVPDVAVTPLKVTIAPNPFHDQAIFNMENADNEPFMLQILDTSGKVLHRQESNQQQVIYQNILPQGIYFYKITNEKGSASGKLMVL